MRSVPVTVGPLVTASANAIALSQSLAGALPVIINGALSSVGVATLDKARRIAITSAGNDSGITFTISGTDWANNLVTEVLTGANIAAANSILDYLTITSIVTSGATAAAITVGTTAIAGSPWIRFDEYAFGPSAIQFSVSGTANFTFQHTQDDPNDPAPQVPITRAGVVWDTSMTTVVAATATTTAQLPTSPRYGRVVLNSGSGSVAMTATQFGVAPL